MGKVTVSGKVSTSNMFFLYLGGRNDMMVYNEDRSVQVLIPSQESGKISTTFVILAAVLLLTIHGMQDLSENIILVIRKKNSGIFTAIKDLHQGSKYQSDVQNTRGICFQPYYHNDPFILVIWFTSIEFQIIDFKLLL